MSNESTSGPEHPKAEQPVDMLAIIKSRDVKNAYYNVRFALYHSTLDSDDQKVEVDEYQNKLQQAIGVELLGKRVIATGDAYTAIQISDTVHLDREELVYYGISIKYVAGTQQIVCNFYKENEAGDNDTLPRQTYYMPFNIIAGLELLPPETLLDILSKQIEQSRVRLVDEKFFQLAIEIQLDILASILNRFREATKHLENKTYKIEAKRFMGFYPGLELSLADSLDDRSDCNPVHYAVLSGTFIGRSFPEVIDQPERHFNSPTDFDLSGGVPCMSFRDDTNEATYVIPIDAITRLDRI